MSNDPSKRCLIPANGYYERTVSLADKKWDPGHFSSHAPFSMTTLG
ncbi:MULTISPECIES: hypothetical protein [unclassified Mesorhizobium]|nr:MULTISPECIES: hypothetical protein [unclassified Mesorhizobium]